MQGKSIVKTIFIIGLLCWAIYSLWPTYQKMTLTDEKRIQLETEGKMVSLVDKAIKMGLDLQGGMYLTLEADLPRLVEQLARNTDDRFEEIMEAVREEMNVTTEDMFTILVRQFEEKQIPLNRYWGERGESDRKVLDYLDKEAKDAMTRSLQIMTNRIDQFGVSEPSIQKVGNSRLLIQLPGVSDPEQARSLIQSTALLEFRMLKDPMIFSETIEKIDKTLGRERGIVTEETGKEKVEETKEKKQKESQDKVVSVSELFGEEEVTEAEEAESDTSLLVDEDIFKENPFIALLRSTGGGRQVSVPVDNIKAVERIIAREDIQKMIPQDAEFLWGSETFEIADKSYRELFLIKKDSELTGKYLIDANVNISQDAQHAGQPEVNFTLNRQGARIISRVSGANIDKMMAIVLDNRVVSAARIQTKLGARSRITGIGDMEEARMVAIVLKAGALPAPVRITQERTVGPSLGRDSIRQGTWSILIGLSIVIIFMLIYYRMSGFIADLALIMNLLVLLAILAQFGFTLTLPGVAGIVLTIGMSVDANVLVFERIREELKTGKTVRASIDAGYSRAFKTILDANVTTLLTALVLYQFGTGPIRGFAVTLSIGIVVSMFTALVVTRSIFNLLISRRTLQTLSI